MRWRGLKIAMLATAWALSALAGLPESVQGGVYHLVKPNEDLLTIVDAYMTPRQVLIEANKLKPPYRLQAGDVLFIPGASRVIDIPARRRAIQETKTPARAPAIAPPSKSLNNPKVKPEAKQTAEPAAKPPSTQEVRQETKPQTKPAAKSTTTTKKAAPAAKKAGATAGEKTPLAQTRQAAHKTTPPSATASPQHPSPQTSAEKTSAPPARGKGFLMPINGKIIGQFGKQANGMFYNGIRIAVTGTATVRASESGVVIYAGDLKGYGSTVILQHAQNYASVYTNLGSASVKLNSVVQRGKAIGVAPSCTHADCYISFELRHRNKAIDPIGSLVKS